MKSQQIGLTVLSCLVLFFVCSGIGNMYVMRNSRQGNLVYIFEQKMDKDSPSNNVSGIKYDYTYVEEPDSVAFLSTIVLKNTQTPLTISFVNDKTNYTRPGELIYVQPKGKSFEYRLKMEIPYSEWKSFYENPTPFHIVYTFENNGVSTEYSFGYSGKKWLSNREKILQIINLIDLNKK